MEKVIYVFNKFYYSFIGDVLSTLKETDALYEKFESAKNSREKHSVTTHRLIERFVDGLKPDMFAASLENAPDMCTATPISGLRLVRKLTVADCVAGLKDIDMDMIKTYIFTFTILGYVYGKSLTNDDASDSDSENDDHNKDVVNNLCDNVLSCFKQIQNGEKPDTLNVGDENVVILINNLAKVLTPRTTESFKSIDPNMTSSTADMLQNSKIGSLAKEISEEIDLSQLNLDKPEDLLNPQNILGGGGNNVLTDIISKVGAKIHQKIDKGEIRHDELMSEAIGMLGMLGKGGDSTAATFLNNPMFKDVMKNMGSFSSMASMAQNSDKSKSSHVRDRLRKKLDAKSGKDGKLL